jgi:hypothetical protein
VYLPEFELVLACLRWPQDTVDADRIRSLAEQLIDWPHVLQIVHHHKVVPLFLRNFEAFAGGCMPEESAAILRAENMTNAHLCQRRSSHLVTLQRLFREQGVDLRVIKGIPLAVSAYQDAALRECGDIDLLIAEKNIFKAGEILRTLGYARFEPKARLTPRRLRSYLAHQKDFSYEHPSAGVVIDLHWRLFRNPFLPSNARLDQVGGAWVHLGAEPIATLPPARLLLYLCVHGAFDGWLRLKWLADIGALLHTMTEEQLNETASLAKEQQALAQFSAAILLCRQMLGPHPAPAGLLDANDRRVAHILRFGERLLTSNHYRPVREHISSSQWFGNELRMHSSFRYRLDLFLRTLFRPRVWSRFDLPDALFPLYALLSPLDWLSFRVLKRPIAELSLVVEALCMLSFFRLALAFVPVQKLTQWMAKPPVTDPAIDPAQAAKIMRRVEWSIAAAVRHGPFTFVCFPQCLAAYFMLRRRHIAGRLFYGVARDGSQLKAHTWVKVGERIIAGGDAAGHFTVLTSFPLQHAKGTAVEHPS